MLSPIVVLSIFFITLVIALLSGLIFINLSVPIKYIKIHLCLLVFPVVVSLLGLFTTQLREEVGPFTLDHLAWLLASFILILGFIIQKFSVRYLSGDRNYRKYLPFFTLITAFASLAWLSGDLRLMALFGGATLFSLTMLIRLNRLWKIPYEVAKISGKSFALGWLSILIVVVLLYVSTGNWHINTMTTYDSVNPGLKLFINILIVMAVNHTSCAISVSKLVD